MLPVIHLGPFNDWREEAMRQRELFPVAYPGPQTCERVKEVLGFCTGPEPALDVRTEGRWERDGVTGEALSWSAGYGPRTQAWLLKPTGAKGKLPGVVALHDHGGFKYYGKEKIAEGPDAADPTLVVHRANHYGGRAFANELARQGFAVLVPDTFMWGSRRFPVESMPDYIRRLIPLDKPVWNQQGQGENAEAIGSYNHAAWLFEFFVIEKYCALFGTTFAGMVSHEDRIAVNYLRSRPDVREGGVGCIGLSGGGNRAALLQATSEHVRASVIVGLMSTYADLLDKQVGHTWMLFPHGWARYGDWPDLAACRAPSPLLVQYDLEDDLFTVAGMRAAHERLSGLYAHVGCRNAYTGEFYPGPHKFDVEMQESAFKWLRAAMPA
jgi:dienelactone hydrolase